MESSSFPDNLIPQVIQCGTSSSAASLKPQKQKIEGESSDQALQYATREIIAASFLPTSNGISDDWVYRLEVAQQPVRARMCGFGEKDRRSLSPLPFVQLHITDNKGRHIDPDTVDPGFFILHATLHLHEQGTEKNASFVLHPTSNASTTKQSSTKNLVGNSAIQGKRLRDIEGRWGIWFVFQDLSIRTDGNFYLKFALTYLGCIGQINTDGRASMNVLTTVDSNMFRVYSAKRFPGMIEATPLSRCFADQGIKIPTRSDKKIKRRHAQRPHHRKTSEK